MGNCLFSNIKSYYNVDTGYKTYLRIRWAAISVTKNWDVCNRVLYTEKMPKMWTFTRMRKMENG